MGRKVKYAVGFYLDDQCTHLPVPINPEYNKNIGLLTGKHMNKKVAIERCPSYDFDTVYAALKQAVQASGDLDVAGKTVLLKPNIVFDAPPEKAACTHPEFLTAAIRLVREMGARRILVGDSPGLQTPGFSAKVCGLGEAARQSNAEWVDFTQSKVEIACLEGKVVKKFTVTRAVEEADCIINLPKLKTHQLMYFTGAMKNLFGLIPSVAKSTYHVRFPSRKAFASMIVDLNLALAAKPSYAFMDAIIGMEGPGPAAGTPRRIGLVLASSNSLAMDSAASEIIAYPPEEIPVNQDALERGVWLSKMDEIEYPLLSPLDVRLSDFVKIPFKKSKSQFWDFILPRPIQAFRDSFAPKPAINHERCIRCGDCTRICASRAMTLDGEGKGKARHVHIDYNRCIRCFCCHEVCPVNAIDITKRRVRNAVAS